MKKVIVLLLVLGQNLSATPNIDMEVKSVIFQSFDGKKVEIAVDENAKLSMLAFESKGGVVLLPENILDKIYEVDFYSIKLTQYKGEKAEYHVSLKFEHFSDDGAAPPEDVSSIDFGSFELRLTFINNELVEANVIDSKSNSHIRNLLNKGN